MLHYSTIVSALTDLNSKRNFRILFFSHKCKKNSLKFELFMGHKIYKKSFVYVVMYIRGGEL